MKKFTVILRFPDYFSSNWPNDIFWTHVKAKDPKAAAEAARKDFAEHSKRASEINDPSDMAVDFVIEGHVKIVGTPTSGL